MDLPDPLQSRLECFMKNNEQLPESLVQELQRGLSKSREGLADLEADISAIAGRLNQLKIRRDRVQKHISQYECVLSPIRRLPTDILHHIFYHCLPTRRDPIMNAKEAPLLLTRVCRAWRQTAHASPPLWARIYITFSDEDMILNPQFFTTVQRQQVSDALSLRCRAVEGWLSRSGACPLSISLCYTSRGTVDDMSPEHSDNTMTLFRLLTQFSNRWESLELTMPVKVYGILQHMFTISQVPMLKSIRTSIYPHEYLDFSGEDAVVIPLLRAPNLKRISLASHPIDITGTLPIPNLLKLTNLSLNWLVPVTQAISLLECCTNLVYLTLSLSDSLQIDFVTSSRTTTTSTISLPHLRTLSITDSVNLDTVARLYEGIDAPLLEWVDYRKWSDPMDPNQPRPNQTAISALFQKSKNLKRLTIEGHSLTTPELRTILRSAQSVAHLAFGPEMKTKRSSSSDPLPINWTTGTVWNFGDLFLKESEVDSEGHGFSSEFALLPHLEVLELFQSDANTFITDQILLDVILSRMALLSSGKAALLKKVAVVFLGEKRIEISEEMSSRFQDIPELRLEYLNQPSLLPLRSQFLSSKYNINHLSDRSWHYKDIEEVRNCSVFVNYATDSVESDR